MSRNLTIKQTLENAAEPSKPIAPFVAKNEPYHAKSEQYRAQIKPPRAKNVTYLSQIDMY